MDDINDENSNSLRDNMSSPAATTTDAAIMVATAASSSSRHSMRNAIFSAALRNGSHESLTMILKTRPIEAKRVLRQEEFGFGIRGVYHSSLKEAITKKDYRSLRMLAVTHRCVEMSDLDGKWFSRKSSTLHKALSNICSGNVAAWRGSLHRSFPRTDRGTLNWLWHTVCCRESTTMSIPQLPEEAWLRVFGLVGLPAASMVGSEALTLGTCCVRKEHHTIAHDHLRS